MVGKEWSAFRGAVRTYQPHLSFDEDDPVGHPLSTQERITEWESGTQIGPAGFVKFLVNQVYYASVSGSEWRSRFASFADVKARKLALISKEADVVDKAALDVYIEQIKYLKDEREAAESLAQEAETLKNESQNELARLNSRLFFLQSQNDRLLRKLITTTGKSAEEAIEFPESIDDLSEWVDKYLPGRVVLHPRAVRAAKKSQYEDVALIYRSLLLLANEYRNTRLNYGEDSQEIFEQRLSELKLELSKSIAPSRAGEEGDQYKVKYPPGTHNTRSLDLHLKNGTSRDLRYCLRIYFFWDQETSQVVIGSLPGHLDTRAT